MTQKDVVAGVVALMAMGAMAVGLSRCGTPQGTVSAAPEVPQDDVKTARQEALAKAEEAHGPSAVAGDFWPASKSLQIKPSATLWSRGGALLIGYDDGLMVELDALGRRSRVLKSDTQAKVMAFSPDGKLAVLGTKPATLVNRGDGRVLIHLNKVPRVSATSFSADSGLWYVVDGGNTIHVWRRDRLMAPATGEDLRAVLQRELPDYSAEFTSVAPPLRSTGTERVLFSDRDGTVYRWDTQAQEIKTLMAMPDRVRSISWASGTLAATSRSGQLRVFSERTGTFLPWAFRAESDWVSLVDGPEISLAVVEEGKLLLKSSKTGDILWSRPIPAEAVCGLHTRSADEPIALCVGSVIALINPADGSLHSTIRNEGGKFHWQDAVGAEVAAK